MQLFQGSTSYLSFAARAAEEHLDHSNAVPFVTVDEAIKLMPSGHCPGIDAFPLSWPKSRLKEI